MTRCRRPSAGRAGAGLALLSLGVLIAGVAHASATSVITPGTGIAGVELKQSESAVRTAVGQPSTRTCARDKDRNGAGFMRCVLKYKKLKLTIILISSRVIRVETTSTKLRTSTGVGPGSTRSALDRAFRRCKDPDKSFCLLGRNEKVGDRYTFFAIAGGRVGRTVVGRTDGRDGCALGCG